MATTLSAPVSAVAVVGEVEKTPAELLKQHEQIVKRNIKRFLDSGHSIARSLNIIYYNDLWKLHKDDKGKRQYTNFNVYLVEEFGWDKTAARARQIMKSDLPKAIEAGEVPDTSGTARTRSAPEISVLKAAKTTSKQLESVLDAMQTRIGNVEKGDPDLPELENIFSQAAGALDEALNAFATLIENIESQSETDGDDDDSDDDSDGDDAE
jgi:hypothetical protein